MASFSTYLTTDLRERPAELDQASIFVPAVADFTPGGHDIAPFRIDDKSFGVVICFENSFPHLVRETAAAFIEVVQRYSADGTFRRRVKRRAVAKGIQLLIVWLVFLAVLVLFGAWMRDCRAARKRGVAQELAVEQWREQLRSMIDEGRVFTTNAVGEYVTYEHVVVEGQWELLQVAMIRNVSEALLMEINGLETGALEVGQVVKIPMTEPEVRLRRAMGHL